MSSKKLTLDEKLSEWQIILTERITKERHTSFELVILELISAHYENQHRIKKLEQLLNDHMRIDHK